MRKLWFIIAGLWLLSVIYFIVYVNSITLHMLVDTSSLWGAVHIAADIALIGGGFALILHFIHIFRRH